jgi:transposase
MLNRLSSEEKKSLIKHHRKERDKRVCDRIKAVLLHDQGYSYADIARILLLDDATIRRHIEDYFSSHKLKPVNGGRDSYLSQSETYALMMHCREVTYVDVHSICVYVEKTFGQRYSISGLTKWLKGHGFCYKKPHGVPSKADDQQQQSFIQDYRALKQSLPADDVIYFADSTHPQHQTRLAYGWIEKGVRKPKKMTACQKRINLIGAINLDTHQVEYRKVDWVNTESLQQFFIQLMEANPTAKKIHLILDNAGYHKSKALVDFVKNTNIMLHYLPPYSPNLNPIERLWKIMHERVTYNRYYAKFIDFTEAILNFFNNIHVYVNTIKSRINDNFQRLTFA